MYEYVEYSYVSDVDHTIPIVLVADIGGTNSNFALGYLQPDTTQIVRSLHVKTQTVTDFTDLVVDLLHYVERQYALRPIKACFAIAGVILPPGRVSSLTNASLVIDIDAIANRTGMSVMPLVNDFQVIGYGLDKVASDKCVQVQAGVVDWQGNRGIIGAGTGLGVSLLHWVPERAYHMPVACEAGHMEFGAQTAQDCALVAYLQQQYALRTVTWEDVLAGRGVSALYGFLGATRMYQEQDTQLVAHAGPHPDAIVASRCKDRRAFDTCQLYAHYYARFAKNWALASVALGGLYIVGGIAAHNAPLFMDADFIATFAVSTHYTALLRAIPIRIITDYNVSLYGALEYVRYAQMGI